MMKKFVIPKCLIFINWTLIKYLTPFVQDYIDSLQFIKEQRRQKQTHSLPAIYQLSAENIKKLDLAYLIYLNDYKFKGAESKKFDGRTFCYFISAKTLYAFLTESVISLCLRNNQQDVIGNDFERIKKEVRDELIASYHSSKRKTECFKQMEKIYEHKPY